MNRDPRAGLTRSSSGAQPKRMSRMQPIANVLLNFSLDDKGGRITREFQDYGYRLCKELDDEQHKSLYIKLAKTVDRSLLEQARTFVLDANAKSKAKLFMWKLGELRRARSARGERAQPRGKSE